MSDTDPWFWSVDEVVTQLCHSFALFLTAAQPATNIPDCSALETELRMQNITGEALLKFDASRLVIGNELRISLLNQRVALHAVIGVLQGRSYAYKLFKASAAAGPCNGAEASPAIQKQRRVEPLLEPSREAPQMQPQSDEFDYLLRWQDTAEDDEEIIDFAADDNLGDDECADWPDVTQAEDDLDVDSNEIEDLPKRCKLSDKEIFDIIDERINFYMDSWRPNAGVVPGEEVDYDVNAMWDKAEALGQRQDLVRKYKAEYKYFKKRLDRWRMEIKEFPGNNANQIRQQCRNLEGTIESMELARWLRDIYKLDPVADGDAELEDDDEEPEDSDEELEDGNDKLVNHPDEAVRDAPSTKSHAVADIEIVDLDSLPEPIEREKSIPDAAYLFGIPMKHQPQTSTPKSRITPSIEPLISNLHESRNSTRILSNHGDEPEKASLRSVRRWKWHELIEHLDRKRIVSKAIAEMNVRDREAIRTRVRLLEKSSLLKEIVACINMLRKGESQLQGILPQDMRKIISFTNLFLSWWFCKNHFKEPNASVSDLKELQSCIEDGFAGTTIFYDYVRTIMQTTFSEEALQHPEQPSQAEIIEISDDD